MYHNNFYILNYIKIKKKLHISGFHQIDDIIKNFFPGSAEELQLLDDKITREVEFVEMQTMSPRLSQLKSVLPLFVIPGFKPKLIETLYKQLLYPVFEAQLPEHFNSIDELSEILVDVSLELLTQVLLSYKTNVCFNLI